MRWHDMTGWSWAWMVVMMVLFWSLLIAAIVALLGRGRTTRRPTALEILDERLAHGDITVDEYEQRRKVLADRDVRRRS